MAYNFAIYGNFPFNEWMQVMWHGLKMDFSVTGYFTVIPALALIVSVWVNAKWIKYVLQWYGTILIAIVSFLILSDAVLYSFWGFHLDSTVLIYLRTPKEAMASLTGWQIAAFIIAYVGYFLFCFWAYKRIVSNPAAKLPETKWYVSFVFLILLGLLIIPIRGGFTASTMNVGQVYFSNNNSLNHAAVNPVFNLMYSLSKDEDYAQQYHFMDDTQAERLFAQMQYTSLSDSITQLITKEPLPNVIFIVLESFSASACEALGGVPNVMPNMSRLYNEGIAFTHAYANSYRTDRGLVSIFSAYPGQPVSSIMVYPHKVESLPSISKTLQQHGYDTELFYGGDIDFTNMRGYFLSCGIEQITSDKDFPLKERMSKWGAPDHFVFQRMLQELEKPQKEPFFKVLLTLSSHEPFEVPFNKFEDPFLNAIAYTDSCFGSFIDQLKASPYWDNTLVVCVPDHAAFYPRNIGNESVQRYHIPMLMLGGVVQPRVVSSVCSQIDLAATIMYQLGLPHDQFIFSKNALNPNGSHFAFYAFSDGFGYVTATDTAIYDHATDTNILLQGVNPDSAMLKGKAFLQYLYQDFSKR